VRQQPAIFFGLGRRRLARFFWNPGRFQKAWLVQPVQATARIQENMAGVVHVLHALDSGGGSVSKTLVESETQSVQSRT
jgi:hypothetical protein